MPYQSGEEPAVGDVVEATESFEGLRDTVVQGEVYKVVSVVHGNVKMRGQHAPWDAKRFNLITR